eukprot:3543995-Amphidinium_carterae.1
MRAPAHHVPIPLIGSSVMQDRSLTWVTENVVVSGAALGVCMAARKSTRTADPFACAGASYHSLLD